MTNRVSYLGVDQGSSSTKGALIDDGARVLAEFVVPVPPRLEHDREVEQDPEGLLSSVVEVFLKAKEWARNNQSQIAAAGIATQRSGVLAWRSSDGVVVHPMITWADTRTAPIIQDLGKATERISSMTGLPTIPNFAAGKIHLLQRKFLEPSIKVGTLDTFIIYRLSAREKFITEDTMAARTMLYSLQEASWKDRLCSDFRVDSARLPRITASLGRHALFGEIPITALLGDQQAALLGHGRQEKRALLNLGTIASLCRATEKSILQRVGLMTSVLFSAEEDEKSRERSFLTEITSAITGTVLLEPVRRGWCQDSTTMRALCEESLAASPDGRAIAYFVHHQPRPPHHPISTPNVMVARAEATIADKTRAIVENVGNLLARLIEEFADKGALEEWTEIIVAGGGSDHDYLLQYLSDISGRILHRLPTREATARGAACAARAGLLKLNDPFAPLVEDAVATYAPRNPERRRRYLMWQRLEQDVFNARLPAHAEIEP